MPLASPLILLLLFHATLRLHAADVRYIHVSKTVAYLQTGPGNPGVQPNGYEFRARVDLTVNQSVSAASVRWPAPVNTTRPLIDNVSFWEFSQTFPTFENMNFAHPNGAYRFRIEAVVDGPKTNNLTLLGDLYPNPVHIANFAAAQSVDAKTDFTLRWDPPGTIASDIIEVRVYENDALVFETGSVPNVVGTLNGATTSAVIPKNTLRNGATYRAQVTASRRSTVDATGYPGVPAWALYSRRTEIPLRTIFSTLDVTWYGVAKLKRFAQNSILPPAAAGGYAFTAFGLASDPLNVQSAGVKLPNATTKSMSAAGASWRWTERFDLQQQLDTQYPTGNYELLFQTLHNGTRSIAMAVPNPQFPAAMQISNWNEASAIDPTKPFTLKWLPVVNGTANDFVQVTLGKNGLLVWSSADSPGGQNPLNGRSTAITLPAGLFQPGEAADLTLTCLKANSVDLFSYPQAIGISASACETRAVIRARGGFIPPPVLTETQMRSGLLEFNISAVEGRQYIIQTSTDFQTWADTIITNSPGASFLLRLRPNPAQRALGFRVVAN